jgi:hypothetical protein
VRDDEGLWTQIENTSQHTDASFTRHVPGVLRALRCRLRWPRTRGTHAAPPTSRNGRGLSRTPARDHRRASPSAANTQHVVVDGRRDSDRALASARQGHRRPGPPSGRGTPCPAAIAVIIIAATIGRACLRMLASRPVCEAARAATWRLTSLLPKMWPRMPLPSSTAPSAGSSLRVRARVSAPSSLEAPRLRVALDATRQGRHQRREHRGGLVVTEAELLAHLLDRPPPWA